MNKFDVDKLPHCLALLSEKNVRLDEPVDGAKIKLDEDLFPVKVDCLGELVDEKENVKKSYREDSKCVIE